MLAADRLATDNFSH